MIERTNNNNLALEKIFEEIYTMIAEARSVPFTEKVMIDEGDMANLIDDLKEAIPREIKSATQVLEEQKKILNNAYADADRIVQQAKDEAERIVAAAQAEADAKIQQEEIVKQANAVAEEIKANALRYQEETKTAADEYSLRVKQDSLQYADDMLAYLGENLQSALEGLSGNRQNIAVELQNVLHGNTEIEKPEEE
ncbi:MAG: hypothetical protein SO119_00160 [Phascolarctobacterium sp.]|nr:hypothetical protein [Phascolarctobacterium sp.]